MERTRPQAGQFHIVGSEAQPRGPYTGYFRARGLSQARLYVLVEPESPSGDGLSQRVVEAAGRAFRRESLSLTGALLRSLRAAHEELAAWNRHSLRGQQAGMGVSCLAWRPRAAYTVQVGATLAYVRRRGQLQRLSSGSDGESLGLAETLHPSLRGHSLSGGDAVLLAFSALASRGDEAVAAALACPADEALRRLYSLVSDLPRFAALLIALPPAIPEVRP